MADDARLTISGTGPHWEGFSVSVDGKVLPVLRVAIEINPDSNICQATLVLDEFYLDATGIPTHIVAEAAT